ncbi:MAG: serine/threonine-protein kinase [Archangium sp.]
MNDTLLPEKLGKYEVLARLSIGGMAELFLGCLPGPGGFRKFVALKQILPDVRRDEEFVKMFLDEARISAGLVHPNIGQVHELSEDDGGELFLAMEFIAGQNLSTIIRLLSKRNERMPIAIACRVIRDVCLGLHAAHLEQIVHRDVSPKNVMLSYSGQVKVIDFGIAKAKGRLIRTQTGVMKGTLSYMAPEQAQAAAVDARTDLFAVGAIFSELITGQRVFAGTDPKQAILEGQAIAPSTLNSNVPAALDQVVLKALQKKPENRFQSGKVFARAISDAYPEIADDEDLSTWLAERFANQLATSRELFAMNEKNRPSQAEMRNIVQRLTSVDRAAFTPEPANAPNEPAAAPAKATRTAPPPPANETPRGMIITFVIAGAVLLAGAIAMFASSAPEPLEKPSGPQPLAIVLPKPKAQPPQPAKNGDAQAVLDAARKAQAAAEAADWAGAVQSWNDVLLLAPNNFAALRGSGIALVELQRWQEGLTRLEQAAQLSSINGGTAANDAELALHRAKALSELDRKAEAREQLNKAAALAPQVRDLILFQNLDGALPGAAPAKNKKTSKKALPEVEKLFNDGNTERIARNYEAAAIRGEKCVKLDPEYFPCYRLLGSVYAAIGARDQSSADLNKARAYYGKYIEFAPAGDEYVPKVKAILGQR